MPKQKKNVKHNLISSGDRVALEKFLRFQTPHRNTICIIIISLNFSFCCYLCKILQPEEEICIQI